MFRSRIINLYLTHILSETKYTLSNSYKKKKESRQSNIKFHSKCSISSILCISLGADVGDIQEMGKQLSYV
jgi:hypothetical protein